jgi:hypothetical protein
MCYVYTLLPGGKLRCPSILDDYSGELPLAFIALSEDAAKRVKANPAEAAKIKASVAKHVADHMINYKHLQGGVEIIDEIPKNPRWVASVVGGRSVSC